MKQHRQVSTRPQPRRYWHKMEVVFFTSTLPNDEVFIGSLTWVKNQPKKLFSLEPHNKLPLEHQQGGASFHNTHTRTYLSDVRTHDVFDGVQQVTHVALRRSHDVRILDHQFRALRLRGVHFRLLLIQAVLVDRTSTLTP